MWNFSLCLIHSEDFLVNEGSEARDVFHFELISESLLDADGKYQEIVDIYKKINCERTMEEL